MTKIGYPVCFLAALIVLSSCNKNTVSQPPSNDSTQVTVPVTVSYFYTDFPGYSIKDSIAYNEYGLPSYWDSYNISSDGSFQGKAYSFEYNHANQIVAYNDTLITAGRSVTRYTLSYDSLNRLSKINVAYPSAANMDARTFAYGTNLITYFRTSAMQGNDSIVCDSQNVLHRGFAGTGNLNIYGTYTYQDFSYSSYPNPYYNPALRSVAPLFFTLFYAVSFTPEFDYLADVYSKNLPNSFTFGYGSPQQGKYSYDWDIDSSGKVTGGNLAITSIGNPGTGFRIAFSYKTIWVH
jgi:hypothetical protein